MSDWDAALEGLEAIRAANYARAAAIQAVADVAREPMPDLEAALRDVVRQLRELADLLEQVAERRRVAELERRP